MAQHDIDILNIAQQQLVQQCIDMGTPATFVGTVQLPSTVAYPSGVVNATYSVSQVSSVSLVLRAKLTKDPGCAVHAPSLGFLARARHDVAGQRCRRPPSRCGRWRGRRGSRSCRVLDAPLTTR